MRANLEILLGLGQTVRTGKPLFNLQTTITLLVCSVVALSLLVANILISKKVADSTQANQAEKLTIIARMVAHSPLVIEALNGQRDERDIQTFANEIRQITNVNFIVVMDMHKIRKSHPDPSKIGKPFVGGDEGAVMNGQEHISIAVGTLGASMRAFTPVFTPDGKQVGAVAVGLSLNNVKQAVAQSRSGIYVGIGFGVLVGVAGALILARRIKKILFGMEPFAIAKLLEERSAMLQSVREGILAIDQHARITLVNAEAIRLFTQAGLHEDPIGRNIEEYMPTSRLNKVLETGKAELDEEQNLNGITLLANRVPVYVNNEIVGAIATFRDKTEIRQMAEQLTGVRLYAEALRAQSHEFMNKLHVILGMVHMGYYDKLSTYIHQIANHHQTEIGYIVRQMKDPVFAGFILGKLSFAREAGVELKISMDCCLPEAKDPEVVHELITVTGNLVDNALKAVEGCSRKIVEVKIDYEDGMLTLEVSDTGPGISSELKKQMFAKGFSTKGKNRGLGLFLVQRSLERRNGKLEIDSQEGKGTRFTVYLPYESKGDVE